MKFDTLKYSKPLYKSSIVQQIASVFSSGRFGMLEKPDQLMFKLNASNSPSAVALAKLLEELENINTVPERRRDIGDQLIKLGDTRPGVGLDEKGLPDISWVEIPAGPFIYGTDENKLTINTPRFHISRYPITNLQFQTFIDAGGYVDMRWWKGLTRLLPLKPTWEQPNRPRELITWHEALAFTRWLSAEFGFQLSLPTEEQWEKAARGADGRLFPWGNRYQSGYANVDETEQEEGPHFLQETTAVGLFPQSESPFQVADMSGNIWEWCLKKFDQPGSLLPDISNAKRVMRGGSWLFDSDTAQCTFRSGNYPDLRANFIGFRVACASPLDGLST